MLQLDFGQGFFDSGVVLRKPGWELECFSEMLDRLVECEARWIGCDLKEHTAGFSNVDGAEVGAVEHGCDVQVDFRKRLTPVGLSRVVRRADVANRKSILCRQRTTLKGACASKLFLL